MKKYLFLLLFTPLFSACSDDVKGTGWDLQSDLGDNTPDMRTQKITDMKELKNRFDIDKMM